MKERPILFSGPMVRAILEGRKTQTRRAVSPKWIRLVEECLRVNGKWVFTTLAYDLTTPYGQPGDRLWVKETFGFCIEGGDERHIRYPANNECKAEFVGHGEWIEKQTKKHGNKLRPSIFLPRWASRITLEIKKVRVERLNDISVSDAVAEGIEDCPFAVDRYQSLWESINGAGSWDANPWVWVIEFKRL